jgi:hypothetical protein
VCKRFPSKSIGPILAKLGKKPFMAKRNSFLSIKGIVSKFNNDKILDVPKMCQNERIVSTTTKKLTASAVE